MPVYYSGPSSYDRLDIRTTWVTTNILVLLTYDLTTKVLSYDPHAGQGHLSSVLYIINFANCCQNGPPKS
jgi:hypothetical protein